VHCGLLGHFTPKVLLAYPSAALVLLPARLWIPAEGQEYATIQSLSKPERALIMWVVLSMLGVLCVAAFLVATGNQKRNYSHLWMWALISCAHIATTFWLAHRADRSRRASIALSAKPPTSASR
jgi:hypothetical protein